MAEAILEKQDGLHRIIKVSIPVEEIYDQLDDRVRKSQKNLKIKGFRPGKVPFNYAKKLIKNKVLSDLLQEHVRSAFERALSAMHLEPCMHPILEFSNSLDEVLSKSIELFIFHGSFDVLPELVECDYEKIRIERPVTKITDDFVYEELDSLADTLRDYKKSPEDYEVQKKDKVIVNFDVLLDDTIVEKGRTEAATVIVGSNQMFREFEEALIGTKVGDIKNITLDFRNKLEVIDPLYTGKEVELRIEILDIASPLPITMDEMASKFNMTKEKLFNDMRDELTKKTEESSRLHAKKRLLDSLSRAYNIALPATMVEEELRQLWNQLESALKEADEEFTDGEDEADDEEFTDGEDETNDKELTATGEDEANDKELTTADENEYGDDANELTATGEDEANDKELTTADEDEKKEIGKLYEKIAKRRVKLGIVMGFIGRKNEVSILNVKLMQHIMKITEHNKKRAQEVLQRMNEDPTFASRIHAPVFEDAVVDFLLGKVHVEDIFVSWKELMKTPNNDIGDIMRDLSDSDEPYEIGTENNKVVEGDDVILEENEKTTNLCSAGKIEEEEKERTLVSGAKPVPEPKQEPSQEQEQKTEKEEPPVSVAQQNSEKNEPVQQIQDIHGKKKDDIDLAPCDVKSQQKAEL